MSQDNTLFKNITKLAGSVFSVASSAKSDLANMMKHQLEIMIKNMDFVTREEFDVVKKIAVDNKMQLEKFLGDKAVVVPEKAAIKSEDTVETAAEKSKSRSEKTSIEK